MHIITQSIDKQKEQIASKWTGQGNEKSDVRGTNMDTENSSTATTAERNENAGVASTTDFLSMFYLPSSRPYSEDVHFSLSSYNVPFQGAASAVMGGILSVLDTALAALNENEEFDKSDSINEGELQGHVASCVSSERSILKCCQCGSRCQSSASTPCRSFVGISSTNTDSSKLSSSKLSDDEISGILGHVSNQEINVHDLSIVRNDAQESDTLKLRMPLTGSVSTLQLYDENTGDSMKKLLLDLPSESMNDMQIETNDYADSPSESRENEDSEYCLVRNESETNDGWLVICDD